jgi:hypothetical protein
MRKFRAYLGLAIWYFFGLLGCGPVARGPFMPDNPRTCAWDNQCMVDEHCGFPAVDTHPVCLPGQENNTW